MPKYTSRLAFTHDYAKEFGGELGKRLYKHYSLYRDNEAMISPHIQWDHKWPNRYTIDTCIKDKDGVYLFIDCKSRKECHEWMAKNLDNLCK